MINQANSATIYFCNKHNYVVTVAEGECPICKAMRSISWEKIWDNYKDEPEQQLTIVRGSILAYQTGMVVRLAT
jgi:predicted ATP-dependent serine protease